MGSRCDEPIWRAVPIAPTAFLEGRAVEPWPTLSSSGALRAIDVPAKGQRECGTPSPPSQGAEKMSDNARNLAEWQVED